MTSRLIPHDFKVSKMSTPQDESGKVNREVPQNQRIKTSILRGQSRDFVQYLYNKSEVFLRTGSLVKKDYLKQTDPVYS